MHGLHCISAIDKKQNGLLYAPPHTLHSECSPGCLLVSYWPLASSLYVVCKAPELVLRVESSSEAVWAGTKRVRGSLQPFTWAA